MFRYRVSYLFLQNYQFFYLFLGQIGLSCLNFQFININPFADLISNDINRFIIDLKDFNYMNSTGLNVMLMVLTKSRKAGGEAILCNASSNISSLLSVTKLNSVFSVYNSLAEAEEAISKVAN